ncbi:XRE family transcriptional regulator [Apilactobacillus timberlakei]|uniref:helix-turn-helix domain-containing protein n=1 Tax=Apilactobacillus timberlakei TaxID=2008380 RepID=UPI00112E2B27|nr:helix-turn-helix transcriptional regulator [Apilactobacillus timberlakei]TPR18959.1 XRE family transcriptional regulator [Apilactobacillus timberlakei]TPR20876.1 XRE family transcriptional regulator [Apilactobacillus timberlakei]TPR23527.1 XRE family transcriptional regulator [Apilactobacillus timberlakei]
MSLGERLKNLRDDKEISIQELATNTKISANKLYNFEINNEKPNVFQLDKLATCYDLPLNEIVKKEEVNHELNNRYWLNLLIASPMIFTFVLDRYDMYWVSIIIILIGSLFDAYNTRLGAMGEIAKKLNWKNPLGIWLKQHINRGIAYTISILMLLAGIMLFCTVDFAWGSLLGLIGFFSVLASIMIWDANKS